MDIRGLRSIRRAIGVVLVALLAASAPACSQAQGAGRDILYYERLGDLSVSESTSLAVTRGTPSGLLTFLAFGRQFDLELERNNALLRRLRSTDGNRVAGVTLWQGRIAGLPGSWARLTEHRGALTGVIWDGADFYALEQYRRAAPRLVSPGASVAGDTVIYRLTETLAELGDILVVPVDEVPLAAGSNGPAKLGATLKPALSPGLEVGIGLIADAELAEREGSEAAATLLSMANIVDGIFVQQVGIHIRVAELIILDGEPDPFTTADPQNLLGELEQYKLATPSLAPLGLVHLFTARDLEDSGSNQTVGIANFGVLCSTRFGVALTEANHGFPLSALIAAHEFGHNFGAPHDAEAGSACEAEPDTFLMNPILTGSETFSPCSIDQMLIEIEAATCLAPIPPNDLSLTLTYEPPVVLAGEPFVLEFDLDSTGTEDALAIELTVDAAPSADVFGISYPFNAFPDLRCDVDTQPALCTLHRLAGGGSIPFTVEFTATEIGLASIAISVTSLNDSDPANNELTLEVDASPAVRLAATRFDKTADLAGPGSVVSVDIEILNDGAKDASGVELEIVHLPMYFEFAGATLPEGGACAPQGSSWRCPIGALPTGQPRVVSLRLRALDSGFPPDANESSFLEIMLTANEQDANDNENYGTEFTFAAAIADAVLTVDGPGDVPRGGIAEFSLIVENLGPDTIPSMRLFYSNTGMEIDTWSASTVACAIDSEPSRLRCDIGPTLPGETHTIVISGFATQEGSFSAIYSLMVDAYGPGGLSNTGTLFWQVVAPAPAPPPPPPRPQSSGGGGALDLFSLLLLMIAGTRLWSAHAAGRRR